MITKIHEREAFLRLRRDGSRFQTGPLWCSYLLDPDLTPPQVAFAIGRSLGSAVHRNRLRRRLRAILSECAVPPGLMLIGASPTVVELSFDELTQTVHQLLTQLPRENAVSR